MWCCVLSLLLTVVATGVRCSSTSAPTTSATPLSLIPSDVFDGDDGQWSTFLLQVGTPAQTVRVLPGTSAFAGNTIWVVIAEGCWEANPGLPDCENARGNTFTRNQSSTWSTERLPNGGLLGLDTIEEGYLGLDGAGLYGFETVNLGLPNSQTLPTLNNVLVAGIATDNYWLGSLGLSPISFNLSSINNPICSPLGTLANQSDVSGASWAYTAGAFYRSPQVFGSLTIGGYDASRLDSVNVLGNISFGPDFSRDLLIELQSITYDTIGSTPLLSQSVYMFIDSMVSQIWLPLDVCGNFEKAFNLTWNSTTSLYTIEDQVHDALLAQNPTFTFTLGDGSGNASVDITIPYAAFDLSVSLPITNGWGNSSARYFPLQRAQNSSQYVLGRVFLQEAYVIADYDRRNFTVSQALFLPTAVGKQIIQICAPGNEDACLGQGKHSGLSAGAIAGIVIGAVVLLALVSAVLLWVLWLRPKREKQKEVAAAQIMDEKSDQPDDKRDVRDESELDALTNARHELEEPNKLRTELDAAHGAKDMPKPHELPSPYQPHEMLAPHHPHEMPAGEAPAVELEAPLR